MAVCGYEIVREGEEEVMRVDCNACPYVPSLQNNAVCMVRTIDKLSEVPSVSRIVFNQKRNYSYNYEQTQLLVEIANLYNFLVKQKKVLSLKGIGIDDRNLAGKHANIRYVVFNLLRSDPIGAYVETKRLLREARIENQENNYTRMLEYILDLLGKTKLVNLVKDRVAGYVLGSRDLYSEIFRAAITPDFIYTRLMARFPREAEQVESYSIKDIDINVFRLKDDVNYLYHVTPPEFKISEDSYKLLDLARTVLAEHKPKEEEFLDPERMRKTFLNIGRDLLQELADSQNISISFSDLQELNKILVRYTVGFGMLEVLLQDPKVQDITINSPVGQTPIFIVHEDYDECKTNIMPSVPDVEGWATKFRLVSGRPLDEANPVLDTELHVPGARARVAIISNPLNPYGLAYALRRHRDKPWTFPLFINNKMINSLAAGLMSFFIDGGRTILFAGTRSSGKTSMMVSSMFEIMNKYRIITSEDSVTGDSEMIIKKRDRFEKITIGDMVDNLIERYGCWYNLNGHEILGNSENIQVFAMNKEGKIVLSPVTKFIRHKVNKPIYEILTRSGRRIKVTGDHSLFTLNGEGDIFSIKVNELKENDFISVPRVIPLSNNLGFNSINVLDFISKLPKRSYFYGEPIKQFLKKYKYEVRQLAKDHSYSKSTIHCWFRKGLVSGKILDDMFSLGYYLKNVRSIKFKTNSAIQKLPAIIDLDKDFLTFIGLWIADGCYDKAAVIMSVSTNEERQIVYNVAKKLGLKVKFHSDGFSLMIHSSTLRTLMREVLELKGNAYTKRIPSWAFNLSREQISYLLKGIFSGDGCASNKELVIPLCSLGLLNDIQTLLLTFGIIFRIGYKRKDNTYNASITNVKMWTKFKQHIGFLQEYKQKKLLKLCKKQYTHDNSDIIPFSLDFKKNIWKDYSDFKFRDYIYRENNVGRGKLKTISQCMSQQSCLLEKVKLLANSDIFWDRIKEIKILENNEQYVYDISVPECESFVCNNIVAHNTLEIPNEAFRKLGYNIQSMKMRSALAVGGTEVPADEAIRTSLRMGDSSLIVGEIRSMEAKALWEAMRIGALANVVAGTIHGANPYSVFDRVVNDLGVPRTSFKATDIIFVSNPIKSPDGLHKWRRCLQIAEVRKHWEKDPLREKGFVDLMLYDTKADELKPTDDLINGESEIVKEIAGNVKEWAGNWDAVWENILLRAKLKQTLVDYANRVKNLELLEAPFVVKSNNLFYRISDEVRQEVGALDNKMIFDKWNEWLKKEVK